MAISTPAAVTRGFDKLARAYRWMEYLSFGHALQRCRLRFLDQAATAPNALVLGDGDGRFTCELLKEAPHLRVHAIDGSSGMLRTLQRRCDDMGVSARLTTQQADLSHGMPSHVPAGSFDLVVTHFFLDCLTDREVRRLAEDLQPRLASDSRWILSEFAIPEHGGMRVIAGGTVRALYLAFRFLTGLRVQHLPDYRAALRANGWARAQHHASLRGMLQSELWERRVDTGADGGGLQ